MRDHFQCQRLIEVAVDELPGALDSEIGVRGSE
jgi:hypothetical protein